MEMMLEQIQRKVKKEAKKERRSEANDYSKVKEASVFGCWLISGVYPLRKFKSCKLIIAQKIIII
jgi:hypothetical protein